MFCHEFDCWRVYTYFVLIFWAKSAPVLIFTFFCMSALSSDASYTAPHGKPRILIQTYVGFKAPHFFSRKVSTFADWLKVLTFGYLRIILSGIFSCKPFKSVHNIQSFKHGKNFRGQFNKWNYSQTSDWQTASILPKALDSEWSCVHCRNGKVRWKSNLEVDKVSGGCRQPLESPTTPNVILANHLLAASTEKQYWSE